MAYRRLSTEEYNDLKDRIKQVVIESGGAITSKIVRERFGNASKDMVQKVGRELIGYEALPHWTGWPKSQYVSGAEIDPVKQRRQNERVRRERRKDKEYGRCSKI